jgi:hypothetical protein
MIIFQMQDITAFALRSYEASFSTTFSELLDSFGDFWHHFFYPIRNFRRSEYPLIVLLPEKKPGHGRYGAESD